MDILMQSAAYLPHGYCYLWRPGLLSLHVVSDSIITLAYYSIPVALVYFVRQRRDLPFHWMFVMFAVFIVACGTTHLMEIWTLWHPDYWVSGAVKVVTAGASIGTAALLVPLLPKAIQLPSPAQLAAVNDSLRRANNELQAVNEELETFSYSVSHDLRAPLRAIDGFSRVLLEDYGGTLDQEAVRLVNVVRANAQGMGHLIDDLLEFSRLSRKGLETTQVDMAALARTVSDDLSRDATLGGGRARIALGPLPSVCGDSGLLRQVWVNLIGNALKYSRMRSEPRVDISAVEGDGTTIYSVRDNGVGFDQAYAGKLFGVFERLHPADQFEGNGVGLALVQRILQRHGGRVWAESQPDAGATFFFALPKD